MGTPLDTNPPGEPCANCWGVGEVFGSIDTPLYVVATVGMIQPGDFWVAADEQLLLTPHILIQSVNACIWQIDDGKFFWEWDARGGAADMIVTHKASGKHAFLTIDGAKCAVGFQDDGDIPANRFSHSGHAGITFL